MSQHRIASTLARASDQLTALVRDLTADAATHPDDGAPGEIIKAINAVKRAQAACRKLADIEWVTSPLY